MGGYREDEPTHGHGMANALRLEAFLPLLAPVGFEPSALSLEM